MRKHYQKPSITTIEIPERTSYACNIGSSDPYACGHSSNVTGFAICTATNALSVVGTCS